MTKLCTQFLAFFLMTTPAWALPLNGPDNPAKNFINLEPQNMTLINSGVASLEKRLEMIESAQQSIDVEYFIYNVDISGRLFTQALIKKAQQGIKVRMLLDYSIPVIQINKYFATELEKKGIEVRYYNKALLLDLFGAQFRSHRKLLVIDGDKAGLQQAITGGRNIADEYFDLNNRYNFRDTDLYVQGSLVATMQKSFNIFWNSKIVEDAPAVLPPQSLLRKIGYPEKLRLIKTHLLESNEQKYLRETQRAKYYVTETLQDRKFRKLIQEKGRLELSWQVSSVCNNSSFIADYPHSAAFNHVLFKNIRREFSAAKEKIQIQSPYLVLKYQGVGLLDELNDKNVQVEILTNSLNSTDASYTSGALYPRLGYLANKGARIWLYNGLRPYDLDPIIPEPDQADWGIHSKTAVIDKKTIMVGTFNADPRSKNINAEMALICRDNKELGLALSQDFQKRIWQGIELGKDGQPLDGRKLTFGADFKKLTEFYLLAVPSNVFDFLL